ncbi:tRNA (Uracil54-C5-)-methyltransferase [Klebsiella pneumoniae]|uniref:tRNA (Uracil54-C5-)-methyltransferase n=1 Tax=Klebsiella pneumoniae TaxID=573 RepID=A0A378CK08_KLEPN|nr:tRNA (Uracil54-C5-)-methyltransferase [Klebsiella pneumoniae]
MTPNTFLPNNTKRSWQKKVVRLQTMMAPFAAPVPEVFRSPVSHYRMRAEFRLWHDGDDLYHIIFDQQTRSRIRVDSFPAASALINQLMTAMLEGVRNNPVLRRSCSRLTI